MNLKTLSMMGALLLLAGTGANAQKKKEVLNDSNTPLHLLQPAYKVPYGMLTTEEIKADMDRVLRYLEKNTPTRVVDKNTGKVITDYANMTADAQLERGAFRLASYECLAVMPSQPFILMILSLPTIGVSLLIKLFVIVILLLTGYVLNFLSL